MRACSAPGTRCRCSSGTAAPAPLGRSGPLLGALERRRLAGRGGRARRRATGSSSTPTASPTRAARDDRFGDDRLLALLSSVDGAAPAELVRTVDGALRGFEAGPQRDDTAVLAVARLEPGELALSGGPEAVASRAPPSVRDSSRSSRASGSATCC